MLILAASAIETLRTLTPETWVKMGIGLAAVFVAYLLYKRVAGMNKLLLSALCFVGTAFVFFTWVYNRNEPKFMTPVVEVVAPFFPSNGQFNPVSAARSSKPPPNAKK